MANCRSQIPEYIEPDCSLESGRVVALSFIHKDIHAAIYADPSIAGNWVDGAYASDLFVFQEVRGSFDGGSPVDVPGVGNQDVRTINVDRSMTITIPGVKGNEGFWDEMVKTGNYRVAAVVGGAYDLLFINNVDTSIVAVPVVEEGLDSAVNWTVTIKWKDIKNMRTSSVPVGIFN